MRWRAWYTEGRTFAGASFDDWRSLPDDGVLVVMLYHADGTRRIEQGDDWYWLTPEGVHGHDSRQSRAEIEDRYPGASVKRGKWATDDEYGRIVTEAMG